MLNGLLSSGSIGRQSITLRDRGVATIIEHAKIWQANSNFLQLENKMSVFQKKLNSKLFIKILSVINIALLSRPFCCNAVWHFINP